MLDGQCRCAPSGVIQGFDARTGKLAWAWDMMHPDWTRLSAQRPDLGARNAQQLDEQRRRREARARLFADGQCPPTIISRPGGRRRRSQFASSIVAIDVTTGKPRWSFQAVKKDVWDYDFGSQPTLIDYKGTPALLVPSKQGDLYVLDRATGKPLTPVGSIRCRTGGSSRLSERRSRSSRYGKHCAGRSFANPTCGACRRSTR